MIATVEVPVTVGVSPDPVIEGQKPPNRRVGGPKTPEGKARSRRNALKDGLRAKVVFPDEVAATVATRTTEFLDEFRPRTPYERFLVRDMALCSVQIELCGALSIVDLDRASNRAETFWDFDRRSMVKDLGARLAKDPSRIAHALRGCRQGADWLIERWEGLADVLRTNGGWDEDQARLALDMLGVVPELRNGSSALPALTDAEALSQLAAREIEKLRRDREDVLDALDESDQSMSMVGLPITVDKTSARLMRLESGFRRAMDRARNELLRLCEENGPAEPRRSEASTPIPSAQPAPITAAAPHVDTSLTPPPVAAPVTPTVETPVLVKKPVIVATEKPTATAPTRLNRRARREIEKQAREAARRERVSKLTR